MSNALVMLNSSEDADLFIEKLIKFNLEFETYKALKRFILVKNISPEEFPLTNEPEVKFVGNPDEKVSTTESHVIDIGQTGRNWGLLRHTHRDPPWNIHGLRLPFEAEFSCVRNGEGVDLYIIDTGVDPDRSDEFGSPSRVTIVWEEYDSGGLGDDNGHGTAVAAIAAGSYTGFARNAEIFSFKALDYNGSGTAGSVINGMDQALLHFQSRADLNRPAVVNISITASVFIFGASRDLTAAGMVVCAAAGNSRLLLDSGNVDIYPAEEQDVICVGGIQMGDIPYNGDWHGTNYGTRVDILAASQAIWVPKHGTDEYHSWDGTSFGTPHVAGAIACMLQDYQRLTTVDEVRAVKIYLQKEATWGRYKRDQRFEPMTGAILYLNPGHDYPMIPKLTPNLSWDTVKTPIIIGHRGSENIEAPESTIAGMDFCHKYRIPIEGDFQPSSDGVLMMIHDTTVDRTTDGSGFVSLKTYDQLQQMDASEIYRPDLFSPQRIPTLDQFFSYGDRCLLLPEAKSGTGTATAIANAVVDNNLQSVVAIQSFTASDLTDVTNVDSNIKTVWTSSTQISVENATTQGVWGVAIKRSALSAQYISDIKAADIKILAWDVNYLDHAESLLSWGIDGFISADPKYMRMANTFFFPGNIDFQIPDSLFGSGWKWIGGTGLINEGGFATFEGYGSLTTNEFFRTTIPGLRFSNDSSEIILKTKLKIKQATADTTRWFGIQLCWGTDSDTNWTGVAGVTDGYHFAHRLNGGVEIVRFTNGSWTVIEQGTWPALNTGDEIPLYIKITDSSILVSRIDTGHVISSNDTTHARGGYIALVGRGVVPGISAIKGKYTLVN